MGRGEAGCESAHSPRLPLTDQSEQLTPCISILITRRTTSDRHSVPCSFFLSFSLHAIMSLEECILSFNRLSPRLTSFEAQESYVAHIAVDMTPAPSPACIAHQDQSL